MLRVALRQAVGKAFEVVCEKGRPRRTWREPFHCLVRGLPASATCSEIGDKISMSGTKFYAVHAHLQSIAPGLREGSTIQEGDVIGQTGATGNASKIRANEAHLHFETRTRPHPGRGLDFREDPARQTQGLSVRPQDNRSNRQEDWR